MSDERRMMYDRAHYIFVDLDGCLADDTHRRKYLPEHAIKTPHEKYDFDVEKSWDEYFNRAYDDGVNEEVLEFVQDYIRRGLPVEGGVTFDPHYWVILTGRPSRIIGITHKWLNEKVKPLMDKRVANLHYHTLYRSEGDYRKALEVKQELIDNFIDDRESEEKNKNSSRWPQHIQEIHVVDNDLEVINGLKLKRPPLTTHFMCLPTDRIEASS